MGKWVCSQISVILTVHNLSLSEAVPKTTLCLLFHQSSHPFEALKSLKSMLSSYAKSKAFSPMMYQPIGTFRSRAYINHL